MTHFTQYFSSFSLCLEKLLKIKINDLFKVLTKWNDWSIEGMKTTFGQSLLPKKVYPEKKIEINIIIKLIFTQNLKNN